MTDDKFDSMIEPILIDGAILEMEQKWIMHDVLLEAMARLWGTRPVIVDGHIKFPGPMLSRIPENIEQARISLHVKIDQLFEDLAQPPTP